MKNKVKIDEVCRVYDGPHATPTKISEGPIYLGVDAITDSGRLNPSEYNHLSETDYIKWTKRVTPQENDIVFSYEATLGRYAIIPKDFYGCLGRRLAIVRAKDDRINPKWLFYYFLSPQWSAFIANNTVKGSTVNRISVEDFPNFEIPLPTREEQDKIVDILSAIDRKIDNNTELSNKIESMVKMLYDYWFVQFEFPNEEGKPYRSSKGEMVWCDELKKEIPKGWSFGELKDIANITMGQSPNGDSYNDSGNGMIFFQGKTDYGLRFPKPRMYTTNPTRFAKKNDILLSVRAPVGALNIAIEDCCIGRGLAALNSKLGSNMHLYYTLLNFQPLFEVFDGNGTTFGALTKDVLFGMHTVIPDLGVVQKFEDIVSPLDRKIVSCEKENRQLSAMRDWLLPLLMNGQATIK